MPCGCPPECLRIRSRPALLGLLTEGGVDEETAKRIDQGHVERCETAHGLYVDCQVQRVAAGPLGQGERHEGMHGRIAKLADRFVTGDVEHSKSAIASA